MEADRSRRDRIRQYPAGRTPARETKNLRNRRNLRINSLFVLILSIL